LKKRDQELTSESLMLTDRYNSAMDENRAAVKKNERLFDELHKLAKELVH
jgi:hypothetical protein